MEAIQDFEDMLLFFDKHKVRYLIIGGLAFIYHAKPRYTKDMDLWIDPEPENVKRANQALADFGSPFLLNTKNIKKILQLGIAPDRIDIMLNVGIPSFRIHCINRLIPAIIRDQLLHHPLTHVVHAFKSESGRVGG